MQIIVDGIRKIVVLVLLMELVLQLQSGRQYEAYIKMLVGIMVVYSLVSGIFYAFGKIGEQYMEPMQEFQWSGNWYAEFEKAAEEEIEEQTKSGTSQTIGDIHIENIVIEEIKVKEIKSPGGAP